MQLLFLFLTFLSLALFIYRVGQRKAMLKEGYSPISFDTVLKKYYCDNYECKEGKYKYDDKTGHMIYIPCDGETCKILKPKDDTDKGWYYIEETRTKQYGSDDICMTNHGQKDDEYDTTMICDGSPIDSCDYSEEVCDGITYIKTFDKNGNCGWYTRIADNATLTPATERYESCKNRVDVALRSSDGNGLSTAPSGVTNNGSQIISTSTPGNNGPIACPEGSEFDTNTKACNYPTPEGKENEQYNPARMEWERKALSCSKGERYDSQSYRCVSACQKYEEYDEQKDECVYVAPECGEDQRFDLAAEQCEPKPLTCPIGESYDVQTDSCVSICSQDMAYDIEYSSCSPFIDCPEEERQCVYSRDGTHHVLQTDVVQDEPNRNCRYKVKASQPYENTLLTSCPSSCPTGMFPEGGLCKYPECEEDVQYLVGEVSVDSSVWENWDTVKADAEHCGKIIKRSVHIDGSLPCRGKDDQIHNSSDSVSMKASTNCPIPPCSGEWSQPSNLELPRCGVINYTSTFSQTPGTAACTPVEEYIPKMVRHVNSDCEICKDEIHYSHGISESEYNTLHEYSTHCGKNLSKRHEKNANAPCVSSDGAFVELSSSTYETKNVPCHEPCRGKHESDTCRDRDMNIVSCGTGYKTNMFTRTAGAESNCPTPIQSSVICENSSGCAPCSEGIIDYSSPYSVDYNMRDFTEEEFQNLEDDPYFCNARILKTVSAKAPCVKSSNNLILAGEILSTEEKEGPPCEPTVKYSIKNEYIEIHYVKQPRNNYSTRVNVYEASEPNRLVRKNISVSSNSQTERIYRFYPNKLADYLFEVHWKRYPTDAWSDRPITLRVSALEIEERLRENSPLCTLTHVYSLDNTFEDETRSLSMTSIQWDNLDKPSTADDKALCGKVVHRKAFVNPPYPCITETADGPIALQNEEVRAESKLARACRTNCITSNIEVSACAPACGNSTRVIRKIVAQEPSLDGDKCPEDVNTDLTENCNDYSDCDICETSYTIITPDGSNLNVEELSDVNDVNWSYTNQLNPKHFSNSQDLKALRELCGQTVTVHVSNSNYCTRGGYIFQPVNVFRSNQEFPTCHPNCLYSSEYVYQDGTTVPNMTDEKWEDLENIGDDALCERTILRRNIAQELPCYATHLQKHIEGNPPAESKKGGPCPTGNPCVADTSRTEYHLLGKTGFVPNNLKPIVQKFYRSGLNNKQKSAILNYHSPRRQTVYAMHPFFNDSCEPDPPSPCADGRNTYINGVDGYVNCKTSKLVKDVY